MTTRINMPSRNLSASAIGVLVAFFLYVLLVGAAVAVLPPLVAIMMGILPLSALFLNREFAFAPPLRLLHWLFVAAMVLFILWPRYLAFNFGGPDLTPARFVYAMLLGIWVGALVSPAFRQDVIGLLRREPIWIRLVVVYFLLRLVSCFFSDAVFLSLYHITNELLTAALVLPIALSIYRSPRRFESLVFWIFMAGLLVAGLAIVERIVSHTLFANVTIPGMTVDSVWLQQAITDKVREGKYRVQSTFSHPLLLAEFMMFEIPLAIYFAARKGFWIRFLGILGFLLFVAAAVLTGSRSSLVAIPPMLVMAVVLFSFRSQGRGRLSVSAILLLFTLAIAGLCAFILLVSGAIDLTLILGKSPIEAASTNIRILMITKGLPLIADRPFVGYGPGLSGYVLGFANAAGAITIDNYYLTLALDSGILAPLVFVFLFFGVAAKGYWNSIIRPTQVDLLKGLVSISIIGMLIVKSILSIPQNLPLLILCVALVLVPVAIGDRPDARRK